MKFYFYLFLSLFFVLAQSSYAKTPDITSENKVILDVLENGFPPMEIKLYTEDEPSNRVFNSNTNYQFIVQPQIDLSGFASKWFNFAWFFPGGVTSSIKLEGCGIQVGTFLANAPAPGRYTLTVQLWDGAGHTTVVERELVFK